MRAQDVYNKSWNAAKHLFPLERVRRRCAG